jgi:soluble P-type ATPase
MIDIEIPGYTRFIFKHAVLDVNGTIAKDGYLIEGIADLFEKLRPQLELHLVTADTHGRQEIMDKMLGLKAVRIQSENQVKAKLDYVERLGAETVVAIGNGANDSAMLERAALGILIVGPEGSAVKALLKADIIVPDARAALELLLYPKRLMATLRR